VVVAEPCCRVKQQRSKLSRSCLHRTTVPYSFPPRVPNKSRRRCRLTLCDPSRCVDEKRLRHVKWMRECRELGARLPKKYCQSASAARASLSLARTKPKPNLFNRRRLKEGGISVLFGIAKYYLVRPNQLRAYCYREAAPVFLQHARGQFGLSFCNGTVQLRFEWPVLNSNFCVLWSKVSW
jgi:hypothetical protein